MLDRSQVAHFYYFVYSKEIDTLNLRDVMSRDVQVINLDESIKETARHMRNSNFGMMPW